MVVSLYRPWGQRTTFLQQNTYNFNSGWGSSHHCCGGSRGNGGLWAAFGITAGLSLLSNIFGGGNRGTQMTSQYGGYQPYGMMPFDYASFNRYNNPQVPGNQNSTSSTLDNLNKFYSDYTWIYQDGKIYGKNKETGEVVEGETFEELQSKISGTSSRLQNNSGNKFTEQEAANLIKGAGLEDKIKIEDGKLSYTLPDGTEVQERFAELTETNVGKAIAIMLAGTTGADPADATEETDATTDTTTETTTGTTTRSGFSYPELPEGNEWQRVDAEKYKDKTLDDLVKEFSDKLGDMSDEDIKAMLIKANPNAIKNGKVVDPTRLDLPVKKASDTAATETDEEAKKKHKTNLEYVLRMVIDTTSRKATVMLPTGKLISVDTPERKKDSTEDIANRLYIALESAVSTAGWSNVILRNDNFNLNTDKKSNENFDKDKDFRIRLVNDAESSVSTAMTPDGNVYKSTKSTYNDRLNELNEQIKNAGWNNVTLMVPRGKWNT